MAANELPAGAGAPVLHLDYDGVLMHGAWLALGDDPIGWPAWALPHLLLTDPYEGISVPALQNELRARLAQLSQLPHPAVILNTPRR